MIFLYIYLTISTLFAINAFAAYNSEGKHRDILISGLVLSIIWPLLLVYLVYLVVKQLIQGT